MRRDGLRGVDVPQEGVPEDEVEADELRRVEREVLERVDADGHILGPGAGQGTCDREREVERVDEVLLAAAPWRE